jgi:hypothetical protein
VVHQLFVLAGFAGEDIVEFQCRGVERFEPVTLEDVAGDADDPLAQDHLLRHIVAEPLEHPRLPLAAALITHSRRVLSVPGYRLSAISYQSMRRRLVDRMSQDTRSARKADS